MFDKVKDALLYSPPPKSMGLHLSCNQTNFPLQLKNYHQGLLKYVRANYKTFVSLQSNSGKYSSKNKRGSYGAIRLCNTGLERSLYFPWFPADLVTFIEKILNGKLNFLCRDCGVRNQEILCCDLLSYFKFLFQVGLKI